MTPTNIGLAAVAVVLIAAVARGVYLAIAAREALADLERDDWQA
jgi:hypothetical protein